MRAMILAIACAAAVSQPACAGAGQPLAFPGAEGFGKHASGGRGGGVVIVDRLADSGTGTLRACIEATGARTCIFRVSGTIALQSPLIITNDDLTIAGQSSPNGVQIKLAPDIPAASAKTPLIIRASDVVVRHLRIRPGNVAAWGSTRGGRSGVGIERRRTVSPSNIYLDHLSVGYTSDQSLYAFEGGLDVTIAYTLMAYPLSPANHDYGPVLCADQHKGDCGRITLWRSVLSSHRWRNAAWKSVGCGTAADPRHHEQVNTLVSNPGQFGMQIADDHPDGANVGTCVNIVANIVEGGPKTQAMAALVSQQDETTAVNRRYAPVGTGSGDDNLLTGSPTPAPCRRASQTASLPCTEITEAAPVAPLASPVLPAAALKPHLMLKVGAFPRDSLDATWLGYVRDVSTAPATNPDYTVAADYPVIAAGQSAADDDRDGMPARYEAGNGLSDSNSADRNTIVAGTGTCGGYTHLECYLHQRHDAITP